MIILIDEETAFECENFAIKRAEGSGKLYGQRGEPRHDKIIDDIRIGAMAEIAAYRAVKDKVKELSFPDFKIYDKKNKSFDADLTGEGVRFHVKSQSLESAKKYGSSWLFQKRDKLLNAPGGDEFFIFCIVTGLEVEIKGIVSVSELVMKDLVKEPKVWRYRNTKRAIYLHDVINSDLKTDYFL